MTVLAPDDFAAFTQAVHGHSPFPWQERLVGHVLDDHRWPTLLDLPTGSGKTAVLDVAVFTLAASAFDDGGRPLLPRRIVFVVDRRVVVDQASEHAARIAEALAASRDDAAADGVVRTVGHTLSNLGSTRPLRVSVQRGGIPRDDSWAMRPDQPTVMLSTVDQVGSRLLFRGYGVMDRMRPIHAGLLGADTLFLLDEVHLSRPFADTLDAVRMLRGRRTSETVSDGTWQVVQMSATPGAPEPEAFRLTGPDRDPSRAARLVQRLTAVKPTRLLDVGGTGTPEVTLPPVVAKELPKLSGAAVGIVVNRVATARAIARHLGGEQVVLLTGRMRALDRDDRYEEHKDKIRAGRDRSGTEDRLVVVATQSIEAGADLDFDGMITECSPIDSLRQRFGRLDRLGDLSAAGRPAEAIILAPKSTVGGREPDPVYGDGSRETYRFLRDRHGSATFDVGPESADLAGAPAAARSPSAKGPLLLSPHMDMLSQTWPRPHVDPPVGPWLHGFQPAETDVSVIWRTDLTRWHLDQQREAEQAADTDPVLSDRLATQVVAACPPCSPEAMQVPIGAVRSWLTGRSETPVVDVEGAPELVLDGRDESRGRPALCWRGVADSTVVFGRNLRPGDTIVVPASDEEYRGISLHNWDPAGQDPIEDLGDRAQLLQRGVASLRLHPTLLKDLRLPVPAVQDDMEIDELHERLRMWLDAALEQSPEALPGWLRDTLSHLRRAYPGKVRRQWVQAEDSMYLVLSTRVPKRARRAEVDDLDGSDLSNSFRGADAPVLLNEHLDGVGRLAAEFATRCRLAPPLVEDLRLAGELHDLGKADPRFQRWLHDGDEVAALSADALLAKSSYDDADPQARERARRASGYPRGARHELLSLALVDGTPEILDRAHDLDLVLHLVASHHGYCRPLAPVVTDAAAITVACEHERAKLTAPSAHGLEAIHSGVAARYWRLVERHGWWGLAYLESILRLADHRRSQMESEREGNHHD